MKSLQEYMVGYQQELQRAVPEEQVWGVGMFSRVGSAKGVALGQLSGLAGMITRGGGKKLAPGFPMNVIIAVTPTRIIVWDYRPKMTQLRLKRKVAEWPRHSVQVEAVPPPTTRALSHVRFHIAGGQLVELESPIPFGQSVRANDSFWGALGITPPA